MTDKHIILFPSCHIVKGANRSAIYDIQREEVVFVPNDLADFIIKYNGKKYEKIINDISPTDIQTAKEYIEFLLEKELIYLGTNDDKNVIQGISEKYEYFGQISNAIIEVSKFTLDYLDIILSQLDELSCKALQITSYNKKLFIGDLSEIMNKINTYDYLNNIELITPSFGISEYEAISFLRKNLRIDRLVLHSHLSNKIVELPNATILIFTKEKLTSNKCCGNIDISYFTLNLFNFTESKNHNSCLNQKISIDLKGDIKNCPGVNDSYGNIMNTQLKSVCENETFNNKWNITKDQITVCKDCEFRYMCTDCRAYIDDPDDIRSKPLKCGYNPYTNVWEDWSKNPLKEKAKNYYGIYSN